jgi:predicted PurR-regulated permease PerM
VKKFLVSLRSGRSWDSQPLYKRLLVLSPIALWVLVLKLIGAQALGTVGVLVGVTLAIALMFLLRRYVMKGERKQ